MKMHNMKQSTQDDHDAAMRRLLTTCEIGDMTLLCDVENGDIGLFQGEGAEMRDVTFPACLVHELSSILQQVDFDLFRVGLI